MTIGLGLASATIQENVDKQKIPKIGFEGKKAIQNRDGNKWCCKDIVKF